MGPELTITHPYLKGAAEMYEDGVFVTVDLDFLVDAHIFVYEEIATYGRYLCFNHIINKKEDALNLANMLSPLLSPPQGALLVRKIARNSDEIAAQNSVEKRDEDGAAQSDRSQKAAGSYYDSITLVNDDHDDGMECRYGKNHLRRTPSNSTAASIFTRVYEYIFMSKAIHFSRNEGICLHLLFLEQ
ncbi:hypothetical protein RND71_035500 [Anisodus tanguticus]|uniref:Uncharacterized protein n=1 Tax=Anisodus tanguticus TaxID=243964 RepID=A0AAE1V1M6_9SOLA|nr:hypothetical protein RND71_035500 [Anisodus tanguticus]